MKNFLKLDGHLTAGGNYVQEAYDELSPRLIIRNCSTLRLPLKILFSFFTIFLLGISGLAAQNAIVTENAKTGNPASEWQISGAGDLSIQGFATDISYNKGQTARFKIKTSARAYTIRVYRIGYYQGNGARLQGTASVTATLPQSQPNCLTNSSTGLVDCGNWGESASWAIPNDAVSGIYIAKLTRTDTGGSSHITFIVRDDASTSDLLFQTSDATWQAYNIYGDNSNGKSLYTGSGGKAVKVSYNRPFLTRNGGGGGGPEEDWLFNAEYPMIRWIEANGYDVSYTTNVDSDRRGNLITNHKVFLSVGHDEYWSGKHRANVTAARNAGTHLAFFSGNEVYWKTRWETSIDGSGTTYRTLVCYKEGATGENTCNGKCDPTPEWTGLWRTGCEYVTGDPLVDGCNPENSLTGQISWELSDASLQVPSTYKSMRFWRNTSVASLNDGQTASFTYGTIGYEWNSYQEAYRYSYPSGRISLSRTVINGAVHNLSLYRHGSGALVFGAGTVQYSWGLDSNHDRGNAAPSLALQQATLNLFADMGAQPGSRQAGLVAATASTDTQVPSTTISTPSEGATLPTGTAVTISGTASDANVVAGVEVSTDGGSTWQLANGTTNWTFAWTPTTSGSATIRSRAFDDSGNMSSATIRNVTIGGASTVTCPCSVFQASSAPSGALQNDGQALQLGMKFRSSSSGSVTGVRF
ncbi:N,N-dimethylformamidase beta subunit family domain-containing protein, partial [Pontibacter pamirensis]|uniref:N,N-dimethylformamidase beta subunit family domain-containing protein n=1 Tax=Pontibacter pamirensis TaxID=2562824 RepID=UPI001F1D947D